MTRGAVNLITATDKKRLFAGPVKFKGICTNCKEPRNRHCGRCKACPGNHVNVCMTGHGSGAWH